MLNCWNELPALQYITIKVGLKLMGTSPSFWGAGGGGDIATIFLST